MQKTSHSPYRICERKKPGSSWMSCMLWWSAEARNHPGTDRRMQHSCPYTCNHICPHRLHAVLPRWNHNRLHFLYSHTFLSHSPCRLRPFSLSMSLHRHHSLRQAHAPFPDMVYSAAGYCDSPNHNHTVCSIRYPLLYLQFSLQNHHSCRYIYSSLQPAFLLMLFKRSFATPCISRLPL